MLYIVHKVICSVKHNINIPSIIHHLATCFDFREQSSGQYLIYGHGAFSECVYYGIPYSLQTSFLIPSLKSIDSMYF